MPTIAEMKNAIKEIMETEYSKAKLPAPSDDTAVERAFYVRAQDAVAIRAACKRNSLSVSFRQAGQHTLTRIESGNPCKGHEILDKSIKEKDGGYTYAIKADLFERLKGLVGVPAGTKLAGVWIVEDGEPVQRPIEDFTDEDLPKGITGDYDMHDLLKDGDRILAGTSDEESAIQALNAAMLKADGERAKKVKAENSSRMRNSNYALIRHGAQTSYISYLLGAGSGELTSGKVKPQKGMIPDQDKIANISSDICIFDSDGKAHILKSVGSIYQYYKAQDLLNQVPFYYFFNDLAKKHKREIAEYATVISKYMASVYKVEDDE